MLQSMRFGRKMPVPSTAQIKSELRLMMAADALVEAAGSKVEGGALTAKQVLDLVGDLATKHGLSPDRAQMLVDRFGAVRRLLEGAAQNLREWKH